MAALDHSILMVGSDLVVLNRDDPLPPRKALKPIPPNEFNTRMNVTVALPTYNNLNRIIQLPYARLDEPSSQLCHFGHFVIVDPEFLEDYLQLSIRRQAQVYRKRVPWTQNEIGALQMSAPNADWDWYKTADLMNKQFWLKRSARSVMMAYQHYFPEDGALTSLARGPDHYVNDVEQIDEELLNLPKRDVHAVERRDDTVDEGDSGARVNQLFRQSGLKRFSKRPRPIKRWIIKRNPDQGSW